MFLILPASRGPGRYSTPEYLFCGASQDPVRYSAPENLFLQLFCGPVKKMDSSSMETGAARCSQHILVESYITLNLQYFYSNNDKTHFENYIYISWFPAIFVKQWCTNGVSLVLALCLDLRSWLKNNWEPRRPNQNRMFQRFRKLMSSQEPKAPAGEAWQSNRNPPCWVSTQMYFWKSLAQPGQSATWNPMS